MQVGIGKFEIPRSLLSFASCSAGVMMLVIALPSAAWAYLDPGTGSAVIQMVVASVMGGLFILKVYWRKVVAFFGGGSSDADPAASNSAEGAKPGEATDAPDANERK